MEVGIYHPWLKEKGGAEKVVLELAKRSTHEITIYTRFYNPESTFKEFGDLEIKELGFGGDAKNFIDAGLRFGIGSMLGKIPTEKLDALIISEAGLGSLTAIRNNNLPIICYCHTPLRAAHPEFTQLYINEQPLPLKPVYKIGTKIYSVFEKHAWKKFDKVIANSQTTKERIIAKHLKHEKDIEVVHPGADIEQNKPGEYENYFLYPSRFRKYKRQELAIEAFEKADLEGFKLILAGSNQDPEYVEQLRQKAGENVEIKTDVPGDEWRELYRNCYSVLFLAENEDWGIIPVETGSYGKSIISVNEGGPAESVQHGETGFLVEPEPGMIAEKMCELAENPEKNREIGKKARKESKKYSWQKFAEKLDRQVEDLE
ncbi:MAG: glycosyltransferase [Nanohaloarchaea archaeon]|nr:glycosyltransferase [Candidatus Nanohaloarchaea archaeon]